MTEERAVRILGTGKYLPRKRVDSGCFDSWLKLSPGTAAARSGVCVRYFVDGETASCMGAQAARSALESAALDIGQIDAIVCASGSPEQLIPCTASLIQRSLGAEESGISCFDINSTCLSFVTALDTVSYMVAAGRYERVLIVSTEIASVGLDWNDLESCTVLGDGAAAVVLGRSRANESSRVLASGLETYSSGAEMCAIRGGGTKLHSTEYRPERHKEFLFHMEGPAIFRFALEHVPPFFENLLDAANATRKDIRLVIPHQASGPALKLFRRRLNLPEECWMDIIADHGNVIAAGIPMAFHEAIVRKRIGRGDLVTLLGTSAGFAVGGIVLEY